jgi:site-specific recombinase XerD
MVSRVALRAGVTRIPVRSHVIRHTVLTLAVEAGVDLPIAAAMANHSNTGTIPTYLHARASRVNEARERVRQVMSDVIPRTAPREP